MQGNEMNPHFLFFPGVVVHEVAHYLACILLGVRVNDARFWGREEAFVAHEPAGPEKAVIITIAPFILGNLLALEFFHNAASLPFLSLFFLLFFWLGISVAYFSFPSRQDAKNSFSSFVSFYRDRVFGGGSFLCSILWLLAFPLLFLPLAALLAAIALFDFSYAMRWIWVICIMVMAFQPSIICAAFNCGFL